MKTPDFALVETELVHGLEAMGIHLPEATHPSYEQFLRLLTKWNRTYNLTAIRGVNQMVSHHLLDSLSILPFVGKGPLLDVGCGAGLPGIPLAIARPDQSITLLDANGKKTRFCQQASFELGLAAVTVVQHRIEQYTPQAQFDWVVARAFAKVAEIAQLAGHTLKPGGKMLLMKGQDPTQECQALAPADWTVTIQALQVPGIEGQRHLVILEKHHD